MVMSRRNETVKYDAFFIHFVRPENRALVCFNADTRPSLKVPKRSTHFVGRDFGHERGIEYFARCCSEVDGCCIDAITFGISQQSFIAAIEAAQNSRTIVEEQLALAVNLSSCNEVVLSQRHFVYPSFGIVELVEGWMFVMVDQQQTFDGISLIFCIGAVYLKYTGEADNSIRYDFIHLDVPAEIPLCGFGENLQILAPGAVLDSYCKSYVIVADFDVPSIRWFLLSGTRGEVSMRRHHLMNLPEQIMASAAAVDGLTNLLLESLLYAEHGNVVTSRFIAKHRDTPSEFLSSALMALLSDLFTDLDQYKFVFGHMKTLFNARSHLENFDLGSVIYSLMKCVAVLGIRSVAEHLRKVFFFWSSVCSQVHCVIGLANFFLLEAILRDFT
uniref:Uncharacterized protein n=1 Tax=Parascaris equorum TaxID=6256 RepID=A0A914RXS9_PAREQ